MSTDQLGCVNKPSTSPQAGPVKFSGRTWAGAAWNNLPKTKNKRLSLLSPGLNGNPSIWLGLGFHSGTVLALICKTTRKTGLSELGTQTSRLRLNYKWWQPSQLGLWALLTPQLRYDLGSLCHHTLKTGASGKSPQVPSSNDCWDFGPQDSKMLLSEQGT